MPSPHSPYCICRRTRCCEHEVRVVAVPPREHTGPPEIDIEADDGLPLLKELWSSSRLVSQHSGRQCRWQGSPDRYQSSGDSLPASSPVVGVTGVHDE